jgi:8-oxo-dGTP pyrophosphatase MutT (NUDIX family)
MAEQAKPRTKRRVQETSAGGFVLSSDGSATVALIGRETRSRRLEWCVPKGHPEGNETLEQTAVREVFEETGIECQVVTLLGSIDYTFSAGHHLIEKTVHHFLLRQIGGALNVDNDPDHEAVTAKWVAVDDLSGILTHENERRMGRVVVEWLEHNK